MKLFNAHKIARFIIVFAIFIALLAPFLANNKPLWVFRNGMNYFPVFSDEENNIISSIYGSDGYLLPLIPYHPKQSDLKNANYQSPFATQNYGSIYWRHWLGTGKRGEDVLAILIYGTRSALFLAIGTVGISTIIGLLFGCCSAWFYQNPVVIPLKRFLFGLTMVLLTLFLILQLSEFIYVRFGVSYWICLAAIHLVFISTYWLWYDKLFVRQAAVKPVIVLPVATFINSAIDLSIAIPKLPFLILWSVCFPVSPYSQMLCLGLLLWPYIAKVTRSAVLKQLQQDYVLAAKSMGYSSFRIVFNYIWPNSWPTIVVAMLFCGISAILNEVSLAYLGIGISEDITWGGLIHQIRMNIDAWWLVLFPVLAISAGSYALYIVMGIIRKDIPDSI